LVTRFITPNADFFVRGHQGIPDKVNPENFRFRLFNDSSTIKSNKAPSVDFDDEDDEDHLPFAKFSL
jgi:hypothetical protein